MRRFFIGQKEINRPDPSLTGEEARHIHQVLRLSPGDEILLFDGTGFEYLARIREIQRGKIDLAILEGTFVPRESPLELGLGIPFIRSQAMEWILQKGTELGARSFQPFFSARSSRNFRKEESDSRRQRWQKILIESAKQSGRNTLPELFEPVPFSTLLEKKLPGLGLIPYERESSRTLANLKGEYPGIEKIFALIGPEGGFSPDEVEMALAGGFLSVSLGPRILRSETAALALISLLQFIWGDMGEK
jgi:16S rRNA (uracil1498-N3)-methyltransferase